MNYIISNTRINKCECGEEVIIHTFYYNKKMKRYDSVQCKCGKFWVLDSLDSVKNFKDWLSESHLCEADEVDQMRAIAEKS